MLHFCVLVQGRESISLESEKTLVSKQFDSLATIYGEESITQKARFVESVSNFSVGLYTPVELDYSERFEKYLKQIAQKIDPTFNKHVYLFKSPYPNAFTIFRGDVFFHWGWIADAESEASIAYTMGHEIGHFVGAHAFNSFLNSKKTSSLNQDEEIKKWHFEQNQEYYSDSIGFEFASKAGYSWKSGLTGFYEYLSLDTILNHLSTKANVFNAQGELINDTFYDESSDTLFSSHPPTASRVKLRKRMARNIVREGKKNLVSQTEFAALQNHAREKVLERLLNSRDYKLGTIKAFKYYCLSPSNKKYKYYLLEFLRRNYLSKRKVLSYTLFSDVFKFSQDKSIYDNLRWIFRNKSDLNKAKIFVKSTLIKQGNTYNDLINFLENSDNGNEHPEYYLSMSLFHHKDKVKKQKYIDKYLGYKNVQYPDFGQAFKNDNLLYNLRGNKNIFFIFQEPKVMLRTSDGTKDAPAENTSINEVTANKIITKLAKDASVTFFNEGREKFTLKEGFIVNELLPYLYSEVYSDDLAGGLIISGSSKAQMTSPALWTFLYKKQIGQVLLNKNFMYHDETVSFQQNTETKVKAATSKFKFTSSSDYFGESIHSYVFRMITFKSSDFSVKKVEKRGVSKLTKGTLKGEIKEVMKQVN